MQNKNFLVTITGPSLTGKTTLANLLENEGFVEVVSTTTRPMRKGEINGKHYNFVTREQFKEMKNSGLMIEEVEVNGNFYGVSRPAVESILKQGKNATVVVEPHGAQQVGDYCKLNNIPVFKVFIDNPVELLISRFKQRYANDDKADEVTYKNRLWTMTMVEPKEWIEPAYNGQHYYDKVFSEFTPEIQEQVIFELLAEISKKSDNKNKQRLR